MNTYVVKFVGSALADQKIIADEISVEENPSRYEFAVEKVINRNGHEYKVDEIVAIIPYDNVRYVIRDKDEEEEAPPVVVGTSTVVKQRK